MVKTWYDLPLELIIELTMKNIICYPLSSNNQNISISSSLNKVLSKPQLSQCLFFKVSSSYLTCYTFISTCRECLSISLTISNINVRPLKNSNCQLTCGLFEGDIAIIQLIWYQIHHLQTSYDNWLERSITAKQGIFANSI